LKLKCNEQSNKLQYYCIFSIQHEKYSFAKVIWKFPDQTQVCFKGAKMSSLIDFMNYDLMPRSTEARASIGFSLLF